MYEWMIKILNYNLSNQTVIKVKFKKTIVKFSKEYS
jgi:hypothetical protein